MVTEVTAFAARDGSLHTTKRDAAEADARLALKVLGIFNEGTVAAVVQHADEIYDALLPLVSAEVMR